MTTTALPAPPREDAPPSFSFAQRVLVATFVVLAITVGAVFAWKVKDVLVLFFAACLFAILLSAGASAVTRRVKVSRGVALTSMLLAGVGLVWLGALYIAPQVLEQFGELQRTLPRALSAARDRASESAVGAWLLDQLNGDAPVELRAAEIVGRARGAFSFTLGILGSAALVIIAGLYLAWDPKTYVRGALHLFPMRTRARVQEVIAELSRTLHAWLLARVAAMVVVGILTSAGLLVLKVPMAIALGIVAGLSSFVPIIGFFFAGMLILFFSLALGTQTTLWVLGLYLVVQWIEGHFITPLVEYKAVRVPPAVNLVAQLIMALVIGPLGVLFASPLVATTFVLVRMLYVEDILGDTRLAENEARRRADPFVLRDAVKRFAARLVARRSGSQA